METLEIQGLTFKIVDAGGQGNCLFKCLAEGLRETCHSAVALRQKSHYTVRQEIVNHVVKNWSKYGVWVNNAENQPNERKYKSSMCKLGQSGNLVECTVAADLYEVNIMVVRLSEDRKTHYLLPCPFNPEKPTLHLLFTGSDLEGHFQLLKPLSNDVLCCFTNACIANPASVSNDVLKELEEANDHEN